VDVSNGRLGYLFVDTDKPSFVAAAIRPFWTTDWAAAILWLVQIAVAAGEALWTAGTRLGCSVIAVVTLLAVATGGVLLRASVRAAFAVGARAGSWHNQGFFTLSSDDVCEA
jgi:hypothetical protein